MKSIRGLRPHLIDPWAFGVVVLAFGVSVGLVAWHGTSLRLEVEGARLGWVVLVAFGMTWHGEWGSGWRIGAGLVGGGAAAILGYYGSLATLPVTAFGLALGLGVTATAVALVCHAFPRVMAFAGAAVGFGVGIAGAGQISLRPTTPVDDLAALMLTMATAMVIGVFGSMALRAFIVRMSVRKKGDGKMAPAVARLPRKRSDGAPTMQVAR